MNILSGLFKIIYLIVNDIIVWPLVKGPCEKVTGYMGRRIKEILNADV